MWLFLATEVLLFGGLFTGYAVWRSNHPELFRFGSEFLDTTMGAINTAVLILSSLTMAWAVTAAQRNQQRLLKVLLILTLVGAAGFLVIKYFEYTHKFHEGWYPGLKFYEKPGEHAHTWQSGETVALLTETPQVTGTGGNVPQPVGAPEVEASTVSPPAEAPSGLAPGAFSLLERTADQQYEYAAPPMLKKPNAGHGEAAHGETASHDDGEHDEHAAHDGKGTHQVHPLQDPRRPANAHMFFNIYFMMTGLHALHVIVGMIVIGWIFIRAWLGHFSAEYFTPVDLGGLYWHVVDLIWIFLFPLFYLI